jgi:hypothetical protein
MLDFLGFMAAVLVAAGLYGTLAYRVSMRTADICAAGAQRARVAGVAAVAFAASAVPAGRAASGDPIRALRME